MNRHSCNDDTDSFEIIFPTTHNKTCNFCSTSITKWNCKNNDFLLNTSYLLNKKTLQTHGIGCVNMAHNKQSNALIRRYIELTFFREIKPQLTCSCIFN